MKKCNACSSVGPVSTNPASLEINQLSPSCGVGFASIGLEECLPQFLLEFGKFPWPARGVWAFDGDESVPHYVDLETSQRELIKVVGAGRVEELRTFGNEITRFIRCHLPLEERLRLVERSVTPTLDLAEIRITDANNHSIGHRVHIDWEPREALVVLVPLQGSRTQIFHPGYDAAQDLPGPRADIITAFERWATFHAYEPHNYITQTVRLEGGNDRIVPQSLVNPYLLTRGEVVPKEILADKPGMLPTIHQAGKGARTLLVLNFSYKRLKQCGIRRGSDSTSEAGQI